MRRCVCAEEVAVAEKKIQSYAARMSALETGVAEARRGLAALEKAQEASAQELAKYLVSFGKPVTPCDTVADGVRLAIDHAGKDGTVLCYGSLYLLGDVIHAVD